LAGIDVAALTVQVPRDEQAATNFLRSALCEAALLGRCLVLSGAECLAGSETALALLCDPVVPVIAVGDRAWNATWSAQLNPLMVDAPRIGPAERDQLWQAITGDDVPNGALSGLRLSAESLAQTANYALLTATATGSPVSAELVRDAARRVNGSTQAAGGSKVGFDELVLPEQVGDSVRRLVGWARHREELVAQGLLLEAGGIGRGITALFSGSPGTGKTLAAHVVAAELGLDIMGVDLSAIVDKYIGETQKNLERIFHQAESLNVVLFFDEADALFGRRSEVKDAHDRYANQEVAYLLQRMEQFDGVTILATNLRGNLDPAFSRRLSFIVHFPDPDGPTRRRLWQTHLARLGPVDPADLIDADHLAAAVELTGGDIRNIVVAAGYDAAIAGTLPGMRHVVSATVAEYSKLGRRVPVGGFQVGSA
jgi:predicted nucleic acid-binding protein